MMNNSDSNMAMNAISEMCSTIRNVAEETMREYQSPFLMFKAKIYPDGNQWCALYGENIQMGVCGFGDTPYQAQRNFDNNWFNQKLSPAQQGDNHAEQ
jgi:hypothetical protein